MRISWLWALLLVVSLMLVTAGVAWAHVVVTPDEVPADDYQVLTVRVPTERDDVPTTEIRVEVPEGFTVAGVQPVPGWESAFEEQGGIVTAITWSGGEIQSREFQEFPMQVRTPPETGEYTWMAFQTYEDGEVVEWVGPPEDPAAEEAGEEPPEEPASVVAVVAAGVAGDEPAPAPKEGPASTPEVGIAASPIASYIALGLGVLALVVALLALLMSRRKAS
jgi:uncharacterized protein YcnI